MVVQTEHPYIIKDERILSGESIIKSTRTPVRAIVEMWRLGYGPEEIPGGLPHLSLAAVFDALSYYSDHKNELNQYLDQNKIPDHLIHPNVKDL